MHLSVTDYSHLRPVKPVTINMGMPSTSWYEIALSSVCYIQLMFNVISRFDIKSLDKVDGEEDEKGMLESSITINQLISQEIDAGIPADRIVLGGFSQGGIMTLLAGLTSERKLAGLLVLSGYLPLRNKMKVVGNF